MTGQAHWITFIPLFLGGLLIAWLVLREARAARRYWLERRRLNCPTLHRRVAATVVRDARSGEAIGVQSCSAFADPETVTCDKACVATLEPRLAGPPKPS